MYTPAAQHAPPSQKTAQTASTATDYSITQLRLTLRIHAPPARYCTLRPVQASIPPTNPMQLPPSYKCMAIAPSTHRYSPIEQNSTVHKLHNSYIRPYRPPCKTFSRSNSCLPKPPMRRRHANPPPLLAETRHQHPQNRIVNPTLDAANIFTGMYTLIRSDAHDVEPSINTPKQHAATLPNWVWSTAGSP